MYSVTTEFSFTQILTLPEKILPVYSATGPQKYDFKPLQNNYL